MNLIAIPSENCPICRIPGGQCSVLVKEVESLRAWNVKSNETDFRAEFKGGRSPQNREAYVVHQYFCLKGKAAT